MALKITSYNCRGLPKTCNKLLLRPDICDLLNKSDIVCLQETWYSKQDLAGVNNLDTNFHGTGVSTTDYSSHIVSGHPPGGVAILWREHLTQFIQPVDLNTDWCTAITITVGPRQLYVFSVYLPYQCSENEERYIHNLGALSAILEELESSCYVIMGDWNANLKDTGSSLFANHMLNFCSENDLTLSSRVLLPADNHTYASESWDTSSWLDHVVSRTDFHDVINDLSILYEISDADHIPISMCINLHLVPVLSEVTNNCYPKLKWDALSTDVLKQYNLATENALARINIPDTINCTDVACDNIVHIHHAKQVYRDIVACLIKAGEDMVPDTPRRKMINKPGWNSYVAELYKASKDAYRAWDSCGRPKSGPMYDMYRQCRARCKYSIRYIKSNEQMLRKESLANKLSDHDYNSFWKEIKLMNNCKTPLPTTIDGISGEANIAELWKKHFSSLLNSVESRSDWSQRSDGNTEFKDVLIDSSEIESAIKRLDFNKACGLDGVYAEHLKYSSDRLHQLLGMCLTSFLVHGILPESMLSVMLVPVIKDKTGKITAKDNYRPIALASIVSKVIEIILLDRMEMYLGTKPNQFGFKKKLGTDMCIYAFKEIVDAYHTLNGSIFARFLDASKAFDRVNHGTLFEKLVRRGVPGYIVRILIFWYSSQRMCVRWGNTYSDCFSVSCGVRQGGILSPYLFNIYVDDLSVQLNKCNTGCNIHSLLVTHLMYADDLGPVSWWSLRRNSRLKLMSSELEIVSGSLLGFIFMSGLKLKLKLKTRLRSEPASVLAHHSSQAHVMTPGCVLPICSWTTDAPSGM